MGLKTGVADGQENPWVNVEGMKFYEVQKYFTEVNYQFHPDPFYVNAAWWNGLPEEYRDIITECATKMGEYNDELIDKNSSAAKQTIVDSGCEVYEPSADELKPSRPLCSPCTTSVSPRASAPPTRSRRCRISSQRHKQKRPKAKNGHVTVKARGQPAGCPLL